MYGSDSFLLQLHGQYAVFFSILYKIETLQLQVSLLYFYELFLFNIIFSCVEASNALPSW